MTRRGAGRQGVLPLLSREEWQRLPREKREQCVGLLSQVLVEVVKSEVERRGDSNERED